MKLIKININTLYKDNKSSNKKIRIGQNSTNLTFTLGYN